MYFSSTTNKTLRVTLTQAIQMGLASDGSLFVPNHFPKINLNAYMNLDYVEFSTKLLHEFFADDELAANLVEICHEALAIQLPLIPLTPNTYLLELFHGPTLSFKDFGARFLAECLNIISKNYKMTLVVATSGDTGSAVASAFHNQPNIRVIILYPHQRISAKQTHQITCWGNNVLAFAVKGNFDQCQQLVKQALQDPGWQQQLHCSSANSINLGRLLPQITYYAYSSTQFYHRCQKEPGFIVPTGNLGNATAAFWAKAMGFPIRDIVLATNANKILPEYLQTGIYTPRKSIQTFANAMDVGDPNNFRRLHHLFDTFDAFKANVKAFSASDEDIRHSIQSFYQQHKVIICPHTAAAVFARQQLTEEPYIIVATAHPSKFDHIIEPIIHESVPVPDSLQKMLARPIKMIEIEPDLEKIKQIASDYFIL